MAKQGVNRKHLRKRTAAKRVDGFKRVALILGQDIGYCRGVLRGVQTFAATRERWIFRDAAPSMSVVDALREWKPAGIIAHIFDPEVAEALLKLRKPLVNVTSTLPLNIPLVEVDHFTIGQMAANHFLDSGFRNFGYFGSKHAGFSVQRERGFRDRLESQGFSCSTHHAEYLPRPSPSASWTEVDDGVRHWLMSLPKPIAIFASNDVPARELAEICRLIGLHVPEDVALLGVDDDKLECGLAFPPLSSIAIPSERVGFEAAQMLSHLMSGHRVACDRITLPPESVVVRQSSDIVAVADPDVGRALRYIRQHATKQIGVEDVLREVAVSRRKLERDFQRIIHRTIFAEIRRIRIEKTQRLLATTDLSMPAIAAQSGFEGARRLAVVFGQMTGMTPTEYRSRCRLK
jgi:LacI family transcriptional regulator